ncbi:MAG: transcriptional regulator [Bryobacterales bacterium]|nr:transcriptional regulator [Bryobacterales bacterium]
MWHFGDLRFDPVRRILYSAHTSAHLPPREADLLEALLEAGGKVVSKEQLLQRVWADCAVEEGNITQQVSLLRRALHSLDSEAAYIETLPKIGYRFLIPAQLHPAPDPLARRRRILLIFAILAAFLVPLLAYLAGVWRRDTRRLPVSSLHVAPVRNLTGDPAHDPLCLELQQVIGSALGHEMLRVVQLPAPPETLPVLPQGPVLQAALHPNGGRLRLHLQAHSTGQPRPIWDYALYLSAPPTTADLQNLRAILREAFRPD